MNKRKADEAESLRRAGMTRTRRRRLRRGQGTAEDHAAQRRLITIMTMNSRYGKTI